MASTGARTKSTNGYKKSDLSDFAHTGPGKLAGRYLRMFWHPVYHSDDLLPGHAKPIKVMNVEYTLYRGKSGVPHLVDFRCPHRGTQLSAGWVEEDCIRCFYHGWKYDETGQCVQQPGEPTPFCEKIKIGGYPCRDYLGLVFAYLGAGPPPPFPRYPNIEGPDVYLDMDSYHRSCNYFNNLENALDNVHVGFVHSGTAGSWDGVTESPLIEAEESRWGVTATTVRPGGSRGTAQFGMPNVFHTKALPTAPGVLSFREFIVWWTPIDDESHIQFTVNVWRLPPDKLQEYKDQLAEALAKRTTAKEELAEAILTGRMRLQDVDPASTDLIRLQDDIAQIGQGVIPDRGNDHLGRSDTAVILIRKLWTRELRALAEGRPLKEWTYDVEDLLLLSAWE